jgi:hypothetical protein
MSHTGFGKGKQVILTDVNNKIDIIYNSVSSLSKELGISDRTVNRWALDGKIHKTKSLKFPLVRIKF